MHMGGGLANLVVRGDEPSAFGHGVSPVMVAPAGTGLRFTPVVVVGVDDDTFFEEEPPLKTPATPARRATRATTTTVLMSARRRERWRR